MARGQIAPVSSAGVRSRSKLLPCTIAILRRAATGGSARVTVATTTTAAITVTPTSARAAFAARPRSVQRSARNAFSATARKVTRVTPPTLATARAGAMSWNAYPSSPHESPPNGKRATPASAQIQTAAVRNGFESPRPRSQPTSAPAAAQYPATAASNGTIANAPKYQIHDRTAE